MESFAKKVIPICFILLTLLSIIPSCAFASNQNAPPPPGYGETVDQMKTRMNESVNYKISILENSKANLTNESSIETADKLIADLESIKEEISNAKTQDELMKIKQEIDTLFVAVPEEIKSIPGLIPHNMGSRPDMQNASENFSQGFKNESEIRPEITSNRSQPPEMLSNRSFSKDANATMNGNLTPGQESAGMEEKSNISEENTKATDDSNFIGKLINTLKSLFS